MKKSKQWKQRRHATSVQRKVAKASKHTRRYPVYSKTLFDIKWISVGLW